MLCFIHIKRSLACLYYTVSDMEKNASSSHPLWTDPFLDKKPPLFPDRNTYLQLPDGFALAALLKQEHHILSNQVLYSTETICVLSSTLFLHNLSQNVDRLELNHTVMFSWKQYQDSLFLNRFNRYRK